MKSRYCTRDETARREATKHPIFLLQSRRLQLVSLPEGHRITSDGDLVRDAESDGEDEEWESVSLLEILEAGFRGGDFDHPCVKWHWQTERVFLTRQEAEAWGKARHYRWPDGWQVYCVPCEGELAAAIQDGTEIPGNRVPVPGEEVSRG